MKMKNKKFKQKFLTSFACVLFAAIFCLCSINIYNYSVLLPITSVEDSVDKNEEDNSASDNDTENNNDDVNDNNEDTNLDDEKPQEPENPGSTTETPDNDNNEDNVEGQASGYWTDTNYDDHSIPGKEGEYYNLYDADDLATIAYFSINHGTTYSGMTITLKSDIDISEHYWVPIRNFQGTFDGNGYEITGLTINLKSDNVDKYHYDGGWLCALFATAKNGAVIKNVKVKGSISASREGVFAGILANTMGGHVTVTNCISGVNISCNADDFAVTTYIGGIVGVTWNGTADINNCMNYGNITRTNDDQGTEHIAGICGWMKGDSSISYSINYGNITNSSKFTGGICGMNEYGNSNITNCINYGKIVGKPKGDSVTGGITGQNGYWGHGSGKVTNSFNLGSVSNGSAGSLIGWNRGNVENCAYLSSTGKDIGTKKSGNVNNVQSINKVASAVTKDDIVSIVGLGLSDSDNQSDWTMVDFGTSSDESVLRGKVVRAKLGSLNWVKELKVKVYVQNTSGTYVDNTSVDSGKIKASEVDASISFQNGASAYGSGSGYFFKTTSSFNAVKLDSYDDKYFTFEGWYYLNSSGNITSTQAYSSTSVNSVSSGTNNRIFTYGIAAKFSRKEVEYTIINNYANQFYIEGAEFIVEEDATSGKINGKPNDNDSATYVTVSGLYDSNITITLTPNAGYEVFGIFNTNNNYAPSKSIDGSCESVNTGGLSTDGSIVYTIKAGTFDDNEDCEVTLNAVFVRYQFQNIKINYSFISDRSGFDNELKEGTITTNYGYSERGYWPNQTLNHVDDPIQFTGITNESNIGDSNSIFIPKIEGKSVNIGLSLKVGAASYDFFDGNYAYYVGNLETDFSKNNGVEDGAFCWGGTKSFEFSSFITDGTTFMPTDNDLISYSEANTIDNDAKTTYLVLDLSTYLGYRFIGNSDVLNIRSDKNYINIDFKEYSIDPNSNRGGEFVYNYLYFTNLYEDENGVYQIGTNGGKTSIEKFNSSISNDYFSISTGAMQSHNEKLYLAKKSVGDIEAGQIVSGEEYADNEDFINLNNSAFNSVEYKVTYFYQFNFDSDDPFNSEFIEEVDRGRVENIKEGYNLYFSPVTKDDITYDGLISDQENITRKAGLGYQANRLKDDGDIIRYLDFAIDYTDNYTTYNASYFDDNNVYDFCFEQTVNMNNIVSNLNANNFNSVVFYSGYDLLTYNINFKTTFITEYDTDTGEFTQKESSPGKGNLFDLYCNGEQSTYLENDLNNPENNSDYNYELKNIKAYSKITLKLTDFYVGFIPEKDIYAYDGIYFYNREINSGETSTKIYEKLSNQDTYELQLIPQSNNTTIEINVCFKLASHYDGDISVPEKENNYYIIDSAQDLYWIMFQSATLASTNTSGGTFKGMRFKQTCDIDMSGFACVPIGSVARPFMGYYDGQYYSISNLNIDQSNNSNVGLFGYTKNATIKNLTLMSGEVTGFSNTGAIVGYAENSTFTRVGNYGCTVKVYTTPKESKQVYVVNQVKVGEDEKDNPIYESYLYSLYYSNGYAYNTTEQNSNDETVTTPHQVQVNADLIEFDYNKDGQFISSQNPQNFGGFAGYINNKNDGIITVCYSKGNITTDDSTIYIVGGFVGHIDSVDESRINTCYTTSSNFLGDNDVNISDGSHLHYGTNFNINSGCNNCQGEFIW